MKIHHFSHRHSLLLTDDIKKDYYRCSGCREMIHDSCFKCDEGCQFYLLKVCTELPEEINHPFHMHPLIFHSKSPYISRNQISPCHFCGKFKDDKEFLYHCSLCAFDLDIRCALLSKAATRDFSKFPYFGHPHPLFFIENHYINGLYKSCSACEEPISGPVYCCLHYCCLHCRFFLHKKCFNLPLEINHPSHRNHSLTLLPSYPLHEHNCFCLLCKKETKGFVYCCSLCEFSIETKYTFFDQTFKPETHQHPFILLQKPMPFTCDACGISGGKNDVPCICIVCSFTVHKLCIHLPRTIKLRNHHHSISHSYFLREAQVEKRTCQICYNEVNMEYGSYRCLSNCCYFVHVNCATDKEYWDDVVMGVGVDVNQELDQISEMSSKLLPSFRVLKEIGAGDHPIAFEIEHFSHNHKLILRDEDCNYCCDGCMRLISTAFYCCVECKFFLHKTCAELTRKKKRFTDASSSDLKFYTFFQCICCEFYCSGFGYYDDNVRDITCIRCFELPSFCKVQGHEHPLIYEYKSPLTCVLCNNKFSEYKCRDCGFVLCRQCMTLPPIAWHKHHHYEPDKHPLTLTFSDNVHDKNQCYCDICEEPRDPNKWFYYCALCDCSFHPECALGKYPYVKLGSPIKLGCHQHSLAFVKDGFVRHMCDECDRRCEDVFLKCSESECEYAVHIDCIYDQLMDDNGVGLLQKDYLPLDNELKIGSSSKQGSN